MNQEFNPSLSATFYFGPQNWSMKLISYGVFRSREVLPAKYIYMLVR